LHKFAKQSTVLLCFLLSGFLIFTPPLGQNDPPGNPVTAKSVGSASISKLTASKTTVLDSDTTVSAKAPGGGFIRSFKMKKMYKHVLTALAVVCGIILAVCGNPAGGGENNGDDDITNINFGKITATSTQEEVGR
jgi:hypothetical protein